MKIGYYPGCSLDATSREYGESVHAVCAELGLELAEIDDWNCCGATSAHSTNHLLSVALPARNLALAEASGLSEVLAPCAACFNRLAVASHEIAHDADLAARMPALLERPFANTVKVRNILDVLRQFAPAIREKAVRPLKDVKVACYYGCLLLRPPEVAQFDDPEDPSSMEEVVSAAGATPVRWNRRLDCCGAAFSLSRKPSVLRLGAAILADAKAAGADCIAVACPLCHSNLDFRQKAMEARGVHADLPILFLTEIVGLALGLEGKALGIERHFVPAGAIAARAVAALPAPAGAEVV